MSDSVDKSKLRPFVIKFEVGVIIEKDNMGYIAYCPALKGLIVEGQSEKEVKKNFENAFISYINSALKHRDPLPICSIFKISTEIEPIIENIEIPVDISNCNSLIPAWRKLSGNKSNQ